jgi:hypothetical protein
VNALGEGREPQQHILQPACDHHRVSCPPPARPGARQMCTGHLLPGLSQSRGVHLSRARSVDLDLALSVYLSVCLPSSDSLSALSLSLSLSLSVTLSLAPALALTLTRALSLSRSVSLSIARSLALSRSLSLSHAPSVSAPSVAREATQEHTICSNCRKLPRSPRVTYHVDIGT